MNPTYDVIIAGARSAGAPTAMLAAQAGLRVLVVDRGAAGSDTMSSHNLTRGAALQLDRWGLLTKVMRGGTPVIRASTFHYAGEAAVTVPIRPLAGGPGMLAPRRHRLDAVLVEAAREAGAAFRHNHSVRDVMRDVTGRVTGACIVDASGRERGIRAGVVVGADGLRSTVARRTGSEILAQEGHCLGHVYGYYSDVGLADNHGYFARGLSVGVSPTDADLSVVIVSARPTVLRQAIRELGPKGALESLAAATDPDLGQRLRSAKLVEGPVVFGGTPGFRRRASGPGWALAGDAACFKDPITSHGMTDAFRDAELLADALVAGDDKALAAYERSRAEAAADLCALTAEMARFDQPMSVLKEQFLRLSRVMRDEQTWMRARFDRMERAA